MWGQEEISVPKNDDILVESSPTDLLETKDSENEGKNSSDSFDEDPFELSAVEPSISETLTDEKLGERIAFRKGELSDDQEHNGIDDKIDQLDQYPVHSVLPVYSVP